MEKQESLFELGVVLEIKKNGMPFYNEIQHSYNLDYEQFKDMQQDLWNLKKKWATLSGLK